MKRSCLFVTMLLLLTASAASEAETKPSGDRIISFEFNEISARNLYRILGEMSGRVFAVSGDIGEMKVTMALSNVPAQVAIDTLNRYLHVRVRRVARQDLSPNLPVWLVEPIDQNPSKAKVITDLERELEVLKQQVADTERRLAEARATPE